MYNACPAEVEELLSLSVLVQSSSMSQDLPSYNPTEQTWVVCSNDYTAMKTNLPFQIGGLQSPGLALGVGWYRWWLFLYTFLITTFGNTVCNVCCAVPAIKKTLKMSDLSPRRSNGFKIKREDSSSTWYKWQLLPSPPPPCSSFDQMFPCKHLNFSVCVCLFVLGVTEVVQVVNILCIMDLEPRSLGGFALLRVGITWALGVLNWTKINWHINSGE